MIENVILIVYLLRKNNYANENLKCINKGVIIVIKKLLSYVCIFVGLVSVFNTFHRVLPGALLNAALNNILSLILDLSIFELGMRLWIKNLVKD